MINKNPNYNPIRKKIISRLYLCESFTEHIFRHFENEALKDIQKIIPYIFKVERTIEGNLYIYLELFMNVPNEYDAININNIDSHKIINEIELNSDSIVYPDSFSLN